MTLCRNRRRQGRAEAPADPLTESVDLGVAGPPVPQQPGTRDEGREAARIRATGDATARATGDRIRARHGDAARAPTRDRVAPSTRRRSRGPKRAGRQRGNGQAPSWCIEIKPARPDAHAAPLAARARAAAGHRDRRLAVPAEPAARIPRDRRKRTEPRAFQALEAGDFDKANQLLSAARSAVDGLGGAVEGADEIRQAADEAAIFVNLITQDLGELLDEAGRTDADSWASRFDSLYKGRSIFVDSIITAVPDGTPSSRYELLLRILPPGEATKRDGRPRPLRRVSI